MSNKILGTIICAAFFYFLFGAFFYNFNILTWKTWQQVFYSLFVFAVIFYNLQREKNKSTD